MKAVNLIPGDARRARVSGGGVSLGGALTPAHGVLALLVLALAFVTVYVLTSNTISTRKATLATINAEVAQEQARAAQLVKYQKFEKLEQARVQTVRQIAGTRFDWYGALSDLSKVVPSNTSLQSLFASVAPGATGGTGGSGGSSSLRSDLAVPALEMTGCTKTQDDVARLMSRLRLINGVTRVTLGDSQKTGSAGASSTSSSAAAGPSTGGCASNAPSFDLVVFFKPLPGATATGAGPVSGSPSGSTTTTGSTTTPATTSTTSSSPTPPSAGGQP